VGSHRGSSHPACHHPGKGRLCRHIVKQRSLDKQQISRKTRLSSPSALSSELLFRYRQAAQVGCRASCPLCLWLARLACPLLAQPLLAVPLSRAAAQQERSAGGSYRLRGSAVRV
jgi:hypothetical protein